MTKKIVIIGGGIAGYTLALELASSDLDITIIEKKHLGGVCLNKGCIPTKSLLFLSNKNLNFYEMADKSSKIIENLMKSIENKIEDKKIKYILGEALIKSENTIKIKDSGEEINVDLIVLAIGSETIFPDFFKNIPGVFTSDSILQLESIPKELVIIGGGYIGMEFATLFNNLGSHVTIIEKEDRLLPLLDEDISSQLMKSFIAKGIEVFVGDEIEKIEENVIYLKKGFEILYDKILLAIGRKPAPINSNIEFEKIDGNIRVNEYFETSIKNIFCIGDAKGGIMLAPEAEYDAKILAKNIINNVQEKPDYSKIIFCVFSDPQIGVIEPYEKKYKTVKLPFSVIGKSYCDESTDGFIKLIIDEKKVIIGASVINKNAIEVISCVAVIIHQKMTCKQASEIIFAHPTSCEIIKEAAIKGNLI